jgi:hypothetical protein
MKKLLFRSAAVYNLGFMVPSTSRLSLRMVGIVLLGLYFLAGVVYSFVLPAQARFPDEKEYLQLSQHLLQGPGYSMDGVHLTASRPPGYAFFMSAIEAVGGGIVSIRVVQYLLLTATILLTFRLCQESTRSAELPAVVFLVIIYPVLFYTGATLYPQTLAAFLFAVALTQLLAPAKGFFANLATGLTFGVLILVVPTFLFTLGVVLALSGMLKLLRWRDVGPIVLGAFVLVGAWTARNAVQFHQFVPVASNSGANFLIGNCENTVPYGGSGNIDRTQYWEKARALGLDEFQQDHFYRQAALTWIEEHPVRAVVLYLEKAANFFNVYNEYAPENKAEVSIWKQAVMAVSYGILLALLAWRLVEIKRFPLTAREKLLLLTYALSALTSAIFFTRIRLRLPYDYLLIAVIAMFLVRRLAIARTLEE